MRQSITKWAGLLVAGLMTTLFAFPAMAQNTGGVFGPVVNEGHRSAQYRLAIVPDAAGGETAHAHRLHYQQQSGNFA